MIGVRVGGEDEFDDVVRLDGRVAVKSRYP
jgi:hypothetical protein